MQLIVIVDWHKFVDTDKLENVLAGNLKFHNLMRRAQWNMYKFSDSLIEFLEENDIEYYTMEDSE